MLWDILLLAALGGLPGAAAGDPQFVDTQIGPVQLADQASGRAFVLGAGGHEPEPRFGVTTFRYANKSKTETLNLVKHPGGVRYAFMQFRVGRADGSEMQRMATVGLDTFRSGRGVHLGLRAQEVIRLLGQPNEQRTDGTDRTFFYRCSSTETCPVLKRVKMPQYAGRYSFKGGLLVAFEVGYPYP